MHKYFSLLVTLGCLVLFLTAPEAFSQTSVPTGSDLVFPQIANGDQGNGVWRTNFVFVNNSPKSTQGQLSLFGDTGARLTVGTNRGTNSTFSITIPARGSYQIETDGTGTVLTGWGHAQFDHAVVGSAVFSFSTSQGRVLTVGVLGTIPKVTFLTPADASTGIALANPYSRTQTVELIAFDQNGTQVGTTQRLSLNPGQHLSRGARDFFPTLASNFTGTIKARSVDLFLTALAIGAVPNSVSIVSYSLPTISYDELATAYSGSFTLVGGPNAGLSGTISATSLEHFDSNMFTGTMTTTNSAGQSFSGPVLGNVDDYGLEYVFFFELQGLTDRGIATAEIQSDESLQGFIVDDGAGNYGTFSLSAQSGSGLTGVKRPRSAQSRKGLALWLDSLAQF